MEKKDNISYYFGLLGLFLYLMIIFLSINSVTLKRKINEIASSFDNDKLYAVDEKIQLTEFEEKSGKLRGELAELMGEDGNTDYQKYIDKMKNENTQVNTEIETLYNNIKELEDKKSTLAVEYATLNKKYEQVMAERRASAEADKKKNMILISNIPTISQYPNYPTGCESVALTMLLRYYGVSVNPDGVIANLKKGDLPYDEDGTTYGANPEIEFVGSPYTSDSYGVYNNPIRDVANVYKEGAVVKTNFSFSGVLDLIDNNKPVVVWTSMNLAVPYISRSWIYKPTGEKINWKSNEHAVLLVGYNDYYVAIADPLTGTIRYQSRSVFEARYNYYGKRVVYYA